MSTRRGKVLLAMSGGVDSSVAAVLLRERGYDVVGCFMRLGSPGETIDELTPDAPACDPRSVKLGHRGCCSVSDAGDARLVAAQLGIPFYVVNFREDFGRIMDYFAGEYAAGRTPNPCVRCNDWLKFGKLHRYAQQIDAAFVASGHYARVEPQGPRSASDAVSREHALLRGIDQDKDQSYVLFGLPREQLAQTLLPIGALRKPEVRELARQHGLPVFNKPDSQEICFVPDDDYAGFVSRRLPETDAPGAIVDPEGRVVGEHRGQHRFTIGQRKGTGLALGYPIYVVQKDAASNTVTVGPRELLLSTRCIAHEVNWLADAPNEWTGCWAKYRYNSPAVEARARAIDSAQASAPNYSGRAGAMEVEFDTPQEAVTPGQAIVLYAHDRPERVLGGGWIASVGR